MMKGLLGSVAKVGAVLAAATLTFVLVALRPTAPPSNGSHQAGSAAGPSASAQETQPASPTGCGADEVSADAPAPTVSNRTRGSTSVVIARVVAVGSARWNTLDGTRPSFDAVPPRGAYVYRAITLSVISQSKGSMPGSATVRLPGGTADCFTFLFENTPELVPGRDYAFFLGPSRNASGGDGAMTLTVNEGWPVAADQTVQTPLDGSLSLQAFSAVVAAAASQ